MAEATEAAYKGTRSHLAYRWPQKSPIGKKWCQFTPPQKQTDECGVCDSLPPTLPHGDRHGDRHPRPRQASSQYGNTHTKHQQTGAGARLDVEMQTSSRGGAGQQQRSCSGANGRGGPGARGECVRAGPPSTPILNHRFFSHFCQDILN